MLHLDLEYLFYDPWMLKQQQNSAQHVKFTKKKNGSQPATFAQGIQIINYCIVFVGVILSILFLRLDVMTSCSPPLRSSGPVPVVSQNQNPEVSNVGHLPSMDPPTVPPFTITKHVRYLKWRIPHLYKLYGYGLWIRESPSTKQPKIRFLSISNATIYKWRGGILILTVIFSLYVVYTAYSLSQWTLKKKFELYFPY